MVLEHIFQCFKPVKHYSGQHSKEQDQQIIHYYYTLFNLTLVGATHA